MVAVAAVLVITFLPGSERTEGGAVRAGGGAPGQSAAPGAGGPGGAVGGDRAAAARQDQAGSGTTAGSASPEATVGGDTATPAAPAAEAGVVDPLAAPNCDPATGRLKIPFPYATPCLGWWTGGDNGGATSPGVTADEIKVVAIITEGSEDEKEEQRQMWRDTLAVWTHVFSTWGRKINLVFKTQPGSGANISSPDPHDEAQGRALAVEVAAENPFASTTKELSMSVDGTWAIVLNTRWVLRRPP